MATFCHSFQNQNWSQQRTSSDLLHPVSFVKECNRKGGKCKISRVLQSSISSPQASPKVEASDRFKMETPESIRASLIPGEWVSSIDLSDAYLHIPIHLNSRKYLRFFHRSQVFQFTSLPFGLATAPQVFTMLPEGRLHMRPFQFHLKEHWRYPQSLDNLLPWTETISAHLDWWRNPTNVMQGADLHPKDHSNQLFTDALNEGWGAHLEQTST